MLKLLKYLKIFIDFFWFPYCFGFFRVRTLVVIIDTFLFPYAMEFMQNNHNHTKISKYLQLTGKNKFIG